MNIAFTTTAEQDAAIDWLRKQHNKTLPEGSTPLNSKQYFEARCNDLANSFREAHKEQTGAAAVRDAYRLATPEVQASVKTQLGIVDP